MKQEPGATLDRLIELRIFGRKPVTDVPPYSTSDSAADVVVRALARPPLRWMCLQSGRDWTFHWRRPMAGPDPEASTVTRYVNLITVTAPTRPLAICRAALKLVGPIGGDGDGRGKSQSAPDDPPSSGTSGKPG
ncbi:MAG: hypothetical protein DMF54_00685 [Acidobacteria bacterium]|nr:MAG: hypothetical protein DMF54_00685 [Acidobacteriota bacterium]